ncbi:SDR family oxidoreductase [Marinomonas sp. TW1]|uniref:SDR family oxidoreductase n=1 Tax=Marinomonas sp. TW1 TaxID=1561203 RepID=UPI0007AFB70A|nr:SDR family oxidoreductase [Marinomonas sp. TW1]KZN14364.1 sugar dehydrogenase [Marinomonas sp. TW1]
MSSPIALITGGSRGIGAATARLAAQQGFQVVINYQHNQDRAEQLVNEIRAANGLAECLQADISNEQDVQRLFDHILNQWGPVSALVNNAGILEQQSDFIDIPPERWHRVFATNVFGTMMCCQHAIAHMREYQLKGSIVNVSSLASVLGAPHEYVDYAASKGAIDSFTKGLAKEMAAQGIRVNGVRPGSIYTEMHADGGEANRVDRLAPNIPMQRGGQAEEIAEAIIWLLSEKASYCTGSFLDVAGGR